jgi:hypothetical protein
MAAAHVIGELLETIQSVGAKFEVYLMGGATQESWEGSLNAGAKFGPISYRRAGGDGTYGKLSDPAPFAPPIANKDLPLLRAAFVRSILQQPFSEAELLYKAPADTNELERTVDIILYIQQ